MGGGVGGGGGLGWRGEGLCTILLTARHSNL